jgi:hypothetical protein
VAGAWYALGIADLGIRGVCGCGFGSEAVESAIGIGSGSGIGVGIFGTWVSGR